MDWVLVVVGIAGTLSWLGLYMNRAFVALRVPRLSEQSCPPPRQWPSVAIVVAARDEGETIAPALRSLLALDYPDLRIVVVDDRSTDRTGAIAARLAETDARLKVLRVDELPDGWLGKTHALARGFETTDATYVVFTDADVHMAPDLLRRTVAIVEAERLDHLTLVPRFLAPGPLIGAWTAAFTDGYAERGRGAATVVHESGRTFGFGAFNLVRHDVFASSEGFAWFRLDVLDDLALGEAMRRAGARRGFLVADEGIEVEWYSRITDALRLLEKNAFGALAGYRLSRAVGFAAMTLVLLVGGPIAALLQDRLVLWPLVAAAGGAVVVSAAVTARRYRRSLLHGLLSPLAIVAMGPAMLRAAAVTLRLGGVRWRDTVYPLEALREGRRVSFL